MTSAHEEAAQAALDYVLDHPAGGQTLHRYREGIRSGRYGSAEIIHQHWQGQWPAEQVACFAIVFSEICEGEIAQVRIPAAGTPHQDADRTGNARLLSGLHWSFTAVVDPGQNMADQDGLLRWAEPIKAEIRTGNPGTDPAGNTTAEIVTRELPPGSAPLEIGTTSASATLMHLRRNRAVARWPYGHDQIRLLIAIGEPWQRRVGL